MPQHSADHHPPIASYALLSDCHGSALVSSEGSVDWCCLARFDARPVFARLLDWEQGGFFRIAPEGHYTMTRRYRAGTHVLETRFETADGVLLLTDFLVLRKEVRSGDHESGGTERPVAEDRLIRRARCERGSARLVAEFSPKFAFGTITPHLRQEGPDSVAALGGADALVLQSGVELEIVREGVALGHRTLEAGEEVDFVLSYALPHLVQPVRLSREDVTERLEHTVSFWSDWLARCTYEGEHAAAVRRSALVLKALTNVETGAIVAAPTTSLPEEIGGERNWDYRYSWLRDASFVLDSLFELGFRAEGHAFMHWLHRTTAGIPEQLQIMYGEGGESLLPEVELQDVRGYRQSRPVRIGNAAAKQFQLDTYGHVLHAAWRYHRHEGEISGDHWRMLHDLVEFVRQRWEEPDCGLWEVRSGPEHFVHSKVLSWVAIDRGLRLGEACGARFDSAAWERTRDMIRDRVLHEGLDAGTGCFVRAFGSPHPDASALLFPLTGFLDIDDPRVRATREWIERELTDGCLVRRYAGPDGLPGTEGAFVACSFWLVQHLARAGEVDRARELFEQLLGFANDVGLLSEEVHPATGELLGNFPQALSHIGLVNAAITLERAGRESTDAAGDGPGPGDSSDEQRIARPSAHRFQPRTSARADCSGPSHS